MSKRLLVAWFHFSLSGGISRFIHLARMWKRQGHALEFVSLTDETRTLWPDLQGRILTCAQAWERTWDGVMIPGAGAPGNWLEQLRHLRDDRFGVRVQHILNDPSRRESFLKVNESFKPHVVITNNSHWTVDDYRGFEGDAFFVEPGAVDRSIHHPPPAKPVPMRPPEWHLGGIASKNARPLIEALEHLPWAYRLHLYGNVPADLEEVLLPLIACKRVILHGKLFGPDLAAFYRSLDLVVTTEKEAGWCNTAAEAFANGTPCIVSRPGTIDFARHGENALVLDEVTAESIAEAILELTSDRLRMKDFACKALRTIRDYYYEDYARGMLKRVERPQAAHYFACPAAGHHGSRAPYFRNQDLADLREKKTASRREAMAVQVRSDHKG